MERKKKREVLNAQSRELVVRLRDYFAQESMLGRPLLPVNHIVQRTANALGISTGLVVRITKEKYGASGMEENELVTPALNRNRKKIYDKVDLDAIRTFVFEYQKQNKTASLKDLQTALTEKRLFSAGKSSLRRVLIKIGYCTNKKTKESTSGEDTNGDKEEKAGKTKNNDEVESMASEKEKVEPVTYEVMIKQEKEDVSTEMEAEEFFPVAIVKLESKDPFMGCSMNSDGTI